MEGHPGASTVWVEKSAVDAFLKGANDKQSAFMAMERNPATIDEALDLLQGALHNKKVLFGSTKARARQVTFADSDTVHEVRSVEVEGTTTGPDAPERLVTLEQDMGIVKQDISLIKAGEVTTHSLLAQILKALGSGSRAESPSHGESGNPERDKSCFGCGEPGHCKSECPIRLHI